MHKWDALKRISAEHASSAHDGAARPSVTPQLQAMVFHEVGGACSLALSFLGDEA